MSKDDKGKIIFQACPTGVLHLLTSVLVILTVGGFVLAKHNSVFYFTGVLAILSMFRDETSIFIYNDRFVIRYSNYLGKLMATDLVYYFKDINTFNFEIDRWTAGIGQSLFISFLNTLIPGHQSSPLSKAPRARLKINYIGSEGNNFEKQIDFPFRGYLYSKALQVISDKTSCK